MKTAIFDLLPSGLMHKVINIEDFLKVYVIDHLFGQSDTRQAIFVRDRKPMGLGFRVWMIDHGMLLGGPDWEIRDAPRNGLYFDNAVYRIKGWEITVRNVIMTLKATLESELEQAITQIPSSWIGTDDRKQLDRVRQQMMVRMERAVEIVAQHRQTLSEVLDPITPKWKVNAYRDQQCAKTFRSTNLPPVFGPPAEVEGRQGCFAR